MKTKATKLLCLLLAGFMLMGSLAACGDNTEGESGGTKAESGTEAEGTVDEAQQALNALGSVDYKGEEFTVLYQDIFKDEVHGVNGTVDASGGSGQVINDAVYERNSHLEDRCKLVYKSVEKKPDELLKMVQTEAQAPTGDFQLIDTTLKQSASLATSGLLYDLNELEMDLTGPWWDNGTASFVLEDGVYFMSGAINFFDDRVTYIIIFNKQMQKKFETTVANPYQTVRDREWTLEYFESVIQGVSSDSSGDGKYDAKDTYGFLTTWEYGNTFFIGSDLRYILNDGTDDPSLYLTDGRMEKATDVLDIAKRIYHNNNAAFMSPPGEEGLGVTAFKENRGLFFSEVVSHLASLNAEMEDGQYGVLPVPKYDKDQEFYRTWTHDSGSTFSVTSSTSDNDRQLIGQVFSAMALLSYQYVKPAFYDVTLRTRMAQDPDSPEMLDIVFQNRVYDMAFYFDFGFYDLFKTAVNDNTDSFVSSYNSQSSSFNRNLRKILRNLQNS